MQTAAVELLATHGRLNFFAGLGQGGVVPIDTNRLHYKGLVLTGTTGSSNADYAHGRSPWSATAGPTSSSWSAGRSPSTTSHDALAHAASGQGMKAMVVFDDPSEEQS